MMKKFYSLATLLFAFLSLGFLSSCNEKTESEQDAEAVEEALEEVGDAVKEDAEEEKEAAE